MGDKSLVNLTGEPLPAELALLYTDRVIDGANTIADGTAGGRPVQIGFGIGPVLHDIHERELRGVGGTSRTAIVAVGSVEEWALRAR